MGKRFIDSGLWRKDWFIALSPAEKCAFQYILSECDNVGVWKPATMLADFSIGEKLDWDSLPNKTHGNIEVLGNGDWWITDFCEYQYGEISEDSASPAIKSYVKLLKSHGLFDRVRQGYAKGTDRVLCTLLDKDKDKDKDKDTRSNISAGNVDVIPPEYPPEFDEFCASYPKTVQKSRAYHTWQSFASSGYDPAVLTEAAKIYSEECEAEHRELRYIKHAQNWLRDRAFEDYLGRKPRARASPPQRLCPACGHRVLGGYVCMSCGADVPLKIGETA